MEHEEHEQAKASKPAVSAEQLLEEHSEVVWASEKNGIRWISVIMCTYLVHWMRVGVVVLYCSQQLNEVRMWLIGLVVMAHMVGLGISSAYICWAMDMHSFESVVSWRFVALAVLVTGECVAPNFAVFAPNYVCASATILSAPVARGYLVRMLPTRSASKYAVVTSITGVTAAVIGMVSGALLACLINYRVVFAASAVFAFLVSAYIYLVLRGSEEQLKQAQLEISRTALYSPTAAAYRLLEDEMRFPLQFEMADQPNLTKHFLVDYLASADGVAMVLVMLAHSMRASLNQEFFVWFNVHAQEALGKNPRVSNVQAALAPIAALLAVIVVTRLARFDQRSVMTRYKMAAVVMLLTGVFIALVHWFVSPTLTSEQWWWVFPMIGVAGGAVFPMLVPLVVIETPAQFSGLSASIHSVMFHTCSGLHHAVIGALWDKGPSHEHRWFWRWLSIMHVAACGCLMLYIVYRSYYRMPSQLKQEDYQPIE